MNRYIVFVAVIALQIVSTFSGSIDRVGRSTVVKRANDLLTNEIDLSVNDIDDTEAQKRLKLVPRQADNETTTTESTDRSTSNNSFCDMITSFLTMGCSALSSAIGNMTKMLLENCPLLNSGKSTNTNTSTNSS